VGSSSIYGRARGDENDALRSTLLQIRNRQDSEALTAAHAEIARLAAELSELEESKDLAMKESEEQNEEKLRSIVNAHEELEKRLRGELDVAHREKERITQALGTSDEHLASLVDEKSHADSFARDLQIKLEAIAAEKEALEQELHAREAELLSKLEMAQDAAEAHMMLISSNNDDASTDRHMKEDERDTTLERMRLDIVRLEEELAAAHALSQHQFHETVASPEQDAAASDGSIIAEVEKEREDTVSQLQEAIRREQLLGDEIAMLKKEMSKMSSQQSRLEKQMEQTKAKLEKSKDALKTFKLKSREKLNSKTNDLKARMAEKSAKFKADIKELKANEKHLVAQSKVDAANISNLEEEVRKATKKGVSRKRDRKKHFSRRLRNAMQNKVRLENDLATVNEQLMSTQALVSELELRLIEQTSDVVVSETQTLYEDMKVTVSRLEQELKEAKEAEARMSEEHQRSLALYKKGTPAEAFQWPSPNFSAIAGLDFLACSEDMNLNKDAQKWIQQTISEIMALEQSREDAMKELFDKEREHELIASELQSRIVDIENDVLAYKTTADAALHDVEQLNDMLSQRDNDLASIREQLESMVSNDATRELETLVSNLRKELESKDAALREATDSLDSAQDDMHSMQKTIKLLQDEARAKELAVDDAKSALSQLEEELARRSSLESAETLVASTNTADDTLIDRLRLDIVRLEEELAQALAETHDVGGMDDENAKAIKMQLEEALASLKISEKQRCDMQLELEQSSNSQETLEEQITALHNEISDLEMACNEAQTKANELHAHMDGLSSALVLKDTELQAMADQVFTLTGQRNKLREELHLLESEVPTLSQAQTLAESEVERLRRELDAVLLEKDTLQERIVLLDQRELVLEPQYNETLAH
jgi:chromosome segregation ATPase